MTPELSVAMSERPVPLSDVVRALEVLERHGGSGDPRRVAGSLFVDSRKAVPGSLFVAVRGFVVDGHRYIGDAIANGAQAVICEAIPPHPDPEVLFIRVADSRKALAEVAPLFYGHASEKLLLIGVTGTNGKTTTARLITELLNASGIRAGYIGTGLCRIGDEEIPLERTTPEAHDLQALFSRMFRAGCGAAVMEVSSHALVLGRVHNLRFRCAVFTNLSREHLDFHHTMERYAGAKKLLFDQLDLGGFAVFNRDDPYAPFMAGAVREERRFCCTLQPEIAAEFPCGRMFSASVAKRDSVVTTLELRFPGALNELVQTELPGNYNIMNLLEASAVVYGLGVAPGGIADALRQPFRVPGRMERLCDPSGRRCAFVDYAHTPDALEKALLTLRELKAPDARLVVVFGCGGNRDREKRPEMGRIASGIADFVVLTSDNPRDEDPEAILDEIERGISGTDYRRIAPREEAIRVAVAGLLPGDILLVAGKGHETYQEIAGRRLFFSDQQVLRSCLGEEVSNANSQGAE